MTHLHSIFCYSYPIDERIFTCHGYPDDVVKEHATEILVIFSLRTNHSGNEDPPLSTLNIGGGHSPHKDVKSCCTICHWHNNALVDNGLCRHHSSSTDLDLVDVKLAEIRLLIPSLRKILSDLHKRC